MLVDSPDAQQGREKEVGVHMRRDKRDGQVTRVRGRWRVKESRLERVGIAMHADGEGVSASFASHTATTATPQRLGVPFVRS